jgi:hypothetical protein
MGQLGGEPGRGHLPGEFGGWSFPFWWRCDRSVMAGGGEGDSQAYLGPRGVGVCPGDMMIDWVSPRPAGDAAARSIQAVRLALRGRTGWRLAADWRELAAVIPIR